MLAKVLSALATFLDRFPGRRAWLPLMGAVAILGLVLFAIFPPVALTPVAPTGGGSPALRNARGEHVPARPLAGVPGGSTRYLTLSPGETVDLSPGPVSFHGHPELLTRIGRTWRYRATGAGHTLLTVGRGTTKHPVFLFVSPVAARQVSRPDLDWYRTQYGTGYANCGPAMVSMAVLWSRGEDVPVQEIREEIGYPHDDGAVSFDDIADSLGRHGVKFARPQLAGPDDLRRILDRGHLALVLIQSGAIEKVEGDPVSDLIGRYYDDDEGHYILVKGYTLDDTYFVVYDPYPVDWESNSLRYGDDESMIGKNRLYSAGQLFTALKTPLVLEVWPG
jgi:hypothetical protein